MLARIERFLRGTIIAWALLGGVVLFAIVAINVYSVGGRAFVRRPFPGDFELVELGIAIAVFAFLPYCSMIRGHVSADIFTARARRGFLRVMAIVTALMVIGLAVVLFDRMYDGLLDYRRFRDSTAILSIPIWWAYVPMLVSNLLLGVAGVLTLIDAWRGIGLEPAPTLPQH